MALINKSFNAEEEKFREVFSRSIGLRQYLAERKINWKKRQIESLEIPVLFSYQMISNQTFYVCSGNNSCCVYPRHFLASYITRITREDAVIKKFEEYFVGGLSDLYSFDDGVRVTLDGSGIGSEYIYEYDECEMMRIDAVAKRLKKVLCLPISEFVCLHEKSGILDVKPEYPAYFLSGIDERFFEK